MATYKLTTVSTFTDNTCSEDPEDLQRYVDDIREDFLDHWDTVEVSCDVDGKVYTSKGEGNRREAMGQGRFANHPWHRFKDERPAENLRVLFHDGEEMYMGRLSKISPGGKVATDDDWYVVLDGFDHGCYWHYKDIGEWWWRKIEAPDAIKKED